MTGARPLALEAVSSAPRAARRWLVAQLGAAGQSALADVAVLLVSEVVTNAVLHGRGRVQVSVEELDSGVRVEVRDDSPRAPVRRGHAADATTGRGLGLLQSLADGWGWRPDGEGKVVWFEVLRPCEDRSLPTAGAAAAG